MGFKKVTKEMAAQSAENQIKGGKTGDFLNLEWDRWYTLRFLPPLEDEATYTKKVGVHYLDIPNEEGKIEKKGVLCYRSEDIQKECVLCQRYFELNDAYKKEGKSESAKKARDKASAAVRSYSRVLNREDSGIKPKFFGSPASLTKAIKDWLDPDDDDQEPIDVLDLENGYDIKIKKVEKNAGQGKTNFNTSYKIKLATATPTPVVETQEEFDELLEKIENMPYDKIIEPLFYEEDDMEAFLEYLPEVLTSDEEEEEEEQPKQAKKKIKK